MYYIETHVKRFQSISYDAVSRKLGGRADGYPRHANVPSSVQASYATVTPERAEG